MHVFPNPVTFLEIQNVPLRMVFANPVTYILLLYIRTLVPLIVVAESSSVIGVEGNSSVLRFTVINAFPPVTIDNVRWLLNRKGTITDITNDTMVDNNILTFEFSTQMYSLTISDIQPNYTSQFNLSVSNPAGVGTNFIYLIVEGIQEY